MRISLVAVAAASLAFALTASAAEPEAPAAPPPQDPPTEVSEAVVEGKVTEDPVVCRRVEPTGSRIAKKTCLPQSQWVARSTNSARVREINRVDGIDDQFAPLPPSAEHPEVIGAR